ncbi:MAG: DNA polymerase III subunit delta [Clostridiaceae bacterium]
MSKKFKSSYVFYGVDERLIVEEIKSIIQSALDDSLRELNLIKFEGTSPDSFDAVINACQTLPFMNEKKVVLISRANFLEDSKSEYSKASDEKQFKRLLEYIDKVPEHCILIVYFVFKSKRDKSSDRIEKLKKKAEVIKIEKATGAKLEAKIAELFKAREKAIGKIELKLFTGKMEENSLAAINNEVEKLCCYAMDREITRQDIEFLFSESSDDDIFDLINPLSQGRTEEALKVLDELLFKGSKVTYILNMIEKHYNLLLRVKLCLEGGRDSAYISKQFRLSPYRYEILAKQCRRYSDKQLKKIIELCLESERKIKTAPIDDKTELELLVVNAAAQ